MKKVLFLCIGNSCRSPMAEGFGRAYGSDVMEPASAGLSPAEIIQPLTKKAMAEKNISIDDQFPKHLASLDFRALDLIVNMSGTKLPPNLFTEVRDWAVDDPIGCEEEVYLAVRDQIEHLVMQLILELRRSAARESQPPRESRNPRFARLRK